MIDFWEDDGEIRLEDERAWFLQFILSRTRNPYVFCLHHIRMCMETEIRRPSDLTKGKGKEMPGGIPPCIWGAWWCGGLGLRRRWSRMRRRFTGENETWFLITLQKSII